MKVCSFNVWSDAPRNAKWSVRRETITNLLRRHAPDLAGLQEATLPMVRDLHERLPECGWVGVGRDDGNEAGEFTPIFYRKAGVRLIEHASFWLSADCEKPGRGWDAAHPRIVTWARFVESASGRRFVHLNTHLDHLGREARRHGSLLLLDKAAQIAGGDPVVLTGDLNCWESSVPYRILTGMIPCAITPDAPRRLRDTFYDSELPPEGPRRTYLGLLGLLGRGRIDYIFVNDGFRTHKHAVIADAPPASDHRPVMVEIDFATSAS